MYKTTIISVLLLAVGFHYSVSQELESDCPEGVPCPRQGYYVPNVIVAAPPTQAPARRNSLFSLQTLLFLRLLGIDLGSLLSRLSGRGGNDDFDHEEEGWYEASNNCFYKYFTERVTYQEAMDSCEDKDARLASSKGIYDDEIREELVDTSFEFPNGWDNAWIGLDALDQDDVFVWSDGVTISNTDGLWPGIGPGTGDGPCVVIDDDDLITGQNCGIQEHYLCEHCPDN